MRLRLQPGGGLAELTTCRAVNDDATKIGIAERKGSIRALLMNRNRGFGPRPPQ